MPLTLIYDTETTGFFEPSTPSDDPVQPHLVELSAGLYDESRNLTASFYSIIRPAGWVISPEVVAIHGINMERAMDEGRPEMDVVSDFIGFYGPSALRVAHNEYFDARIMRIAIMRYFGRAAADEWKARPAACTAKMSTKLVNLPPSPAMLAKNMRFPKTPSLAECLSHFFGEEAGEEAHAASFDRDACARIYFHILGLGHSAIPAPAPRAPRAPRQRTSAGKLAARDNTPAPPAGDVPSEVDFL